MNPGDTLSKVPERLIRCAAGMAPAALAERLQEEWLADVAAHPGFIPRLRFALGCCWAGMAIARELGAPLRAAAATGKAALAVTQGPAYRSRGTTIFMLIVAFHVLLIYGIETGFVRRAFEKTPDRITVTNVDTPPPDRQPPPPVAGPKFGPVVVDDPVPTFPSDLNTISVVVPELPGASSIPPTARPIQRVMGGPGKGFPATDDYYPDAARRLGEKGHATVQVCVDATGRLTADPKLTASSGSSRLDQGALRLAKAGSGHYRPTTEDGRAVSSCYPFGIRFELQE